MAYNHGEIDTSPGAKMGSVTKGNDHNSAAGMFEIAGYTPSLY